MVRVRSGQVVDHIDLYSNRSCPISLKINSQPTTFWALGLYEEGSYGFMAGVRFWKHGLGEVGHNHSKRRSVRIKCLQQ